jgi:hypothetical protein
MTTAIKIFNINLNNCNGVLTRLYKKRDSLEQRISNLVARGYNVSDLEKEHDTLVDYIDEICAWRKSHPGCLVEGDPGYSEY